MLNGPFSPWSSFSDEEANAVRDVLLSNKVNYWTGQECREFEKEFAIFSDSEYAIAVANGTVALDLILQGLGIGAGDEVIVTSRTFLASISSIVLAGAVPIFADVDADSQNVTAESISAVVTEKTRAVICVHLAGWPCDMDPIMDLAAKHNLFVIEDCAQAHGARYKGRSVGSIGHASAWSFCQDKIMTTGGEGGMVTCNDHDLWSRMWSFKDHGKSWSAIYEREHPPGFRWLHESFGTNGRMTEMQGVIGRIQLTRMPEWRKARQKNANAIWDCARNLPEGWSRDRIQNALVEAGVPCFSGSCSEVYLEKAFEGTGWRPETPLPVAHELGETSLMFLVHPTLTGQLPRPKGRGL